MARQFAEGPFLINGLIGVASAQIFVDRDLATFRVAALAEAKEILKKRGTDIGKMSDDQAIIVAIASEYRAARDVNFLPFYLDYPEAMRFHEAAEARRKTANGPAARL